MRRRDPDALRKLQAAFEQGGDRRPPLYQWMLSNHDDLVSLFDGARLNWGHLTDSFAELGFQNGGGGRLKPETVRQTWYRVRKRYEAKRTVGVTKRPLDSVEVIGDRAPLIHTPTAPAEDPMAALMAEMNRRSGRN